ncbi:uncharacterized protein N7500_000971 [Penicillium coprophilum]|uniref:uncharacterized protein n=1 Tax=Penicillium coprophilum TaxID=36646 RepID=UPI002382089A|nr:uncharacterized protein N7500_000971 [Penicillium coprophilum]KAJ5178272.1 hypothetical protein N7500_000971 [Penicillium coprophilum]
MMPYEEVLPSTTPKYEFKGIQHSLQILGEKVDEEKTELFNPYIIFTIDERAFLDCFVNSDEKTLKSSWEIYDHPANHLVIKMESEVHAIAHGAFSKVFNAWIGDERTEYPLLPTSTAARRGEIGRVKRPDLAWTPSDLPIGRETTWPSFAIEVAWLEPRRKVEQDIEFWLCQSKGDVKAAMSITVHCRGGKISFEKWDINRSQSAKQVSVFPSQRMDVVRDPASDCPKFNGRIEIPYEDIYLRQKGAGDTNFILKEEDVALMARKIWISQYGLQGRHASSSR